MPRPRRGQPVGEIRPGTMKRFIKYLTDHYKGRLLVVLVCIILSAISMSFSNVFLQQLIDQVILPGMKVGMESVQAKFLRIIGTMGVFYLVGMATSAIYTQIMAGVTQGTLKNLRDEMFDAMEKLPIKYFDTHAHGDVMSVYTNDVDTLRQLISQSLRGAVQNTPEGREGMALGQYIAGMGFSNVGLGIVHSMAHGLSALYDTPHGVACAILLPVGLEYNKTVAGERYRAVGKAMGVKGIDEMNDAEAADATIAAVKQLSADVGIPANLQGILKEEDIHFLAESAFADACRPGNPRDTSVEEIEALYKSQL